MNNKKVFSSLSEVAHVYAQQDQQEGTNQTRTLYFYNTCIYSYGSHYLLAEFVTASDGSRAIMINDKGYSSSTGKHINLVRQATRQYKQFFTSETDFKLVRDEIRNLLLKLSRANKPDLYILPANALYNSFVEYQEWAGGRRKGRAGEINELKKLADQINGDIADVKKYFAKVNAARAEENKKRKAQILLGAKEKIENFYAYKTSYVSSLENEVLRVSQDGAKIETSQRVAIGIRECKVLYDMIATGRNVKGHKIDHYTVISSNGVLQVGCHKILKEEINKIAKLLSW